MPRLNNRDVTSGFTGDLSQSFGPFLALNDDQFVFDVRVREFPLWLGYNARALFGVSQFRPAWTGRSTPDLQPLEAAYERLLARIRSTRLAQLKIQPRESLLPAGLIYQYIALSMLEQYSEKHEVIAENIETNFHRLNDRYGELLQNQHLNAHNFEFGFDFRNEKRALRFYGAAMKAGILTDPRSSTTGRFTFALNLAFREPERQLFWNRLDRLFAQVRGETSTFDSVSLSPKGDHRPLAEFQKRLLELKSIDTNSGPDDARSFLEQRVQENFGRDLQVVVLNRKNFAGFRDRILAMQTATYEPVRQTPPEEFDMLFESHRPLGLLVVQAQQIVAMAYAGQLSLFSQERGVTQDAYYRDPSVYYSMDLTVAPQYRRGMGTILKQAIIRLAQATGVTAIHGRNRDRMARGMWSINLSLGSFELQRLTDDYPDENPHRDCIYYRCSLQWSDRHPNDAKFITRDQIFKMANGIDLQNTIIEENRQA